MGRKKRLPQMAGGSASALSLSRPAQASLTLRPAGSLSRPRRPLSRGATDRIGRFNEGFLLRRLHARVPHDLFYADHLEADARRSTRRVARWDSRGLFPSGAMRPTARAGRKAGSRPSESGAYPIIAFVEKLGAKPRRPAYRAKTHTNQKQRAGHQDERAYDQEKSVGHNVG